MQCFACNREATQRCPRCGNAYCEGHGTDFCAACLDPMNAAPSRSTFRIAIVGFLGGCVLALWLLIRPPGVPGETSSVINNGAPTPSPAITPAGAGGDGSPTLVPTGSAPASTATPGAGSATPTTGPTTGPTAAPTAAPTPAPAGPISYVVQDGDTWFGIAGAYSVDAATLASFNGRTLSDTDFLQVGETILIPQ